MRFHAAWRPGSGPAACQTLAGNEVRPSKEYAGEEATISEAMFEGDRDRSVFPVDALAFARKSRPPISVVLPTCGDYEGIRICFDQRMQFEEENGYRFIAVWAPGPDPRPRDLCLEYARMAGSPISKIASTWAPAAPSTPSAPKSLDAGRDDVILHNNDTIYSATGPCDCRPL